MQWLPNQDWREAAFTFNWWQMQPSCQKFIRATCKILIPTSFISLTHNIISKTQTSLHFKLFMWCCSSDDSAQLIDSGIVAYKQQWHCLSVILCLILSLLKKQLHIPPPYLGHFPIFHHFLTPSLKYEWKNQIIFVYNWILKGKVPTIWCSKNMISQWDIIWMIDT